MVCLVAVDDLRLDRLPFHAPEGARVASTVTLADLAAKGRSYERYVTPSTSTSAAVATLLSGLSPGEHGLRSARDVGRHRFPARHRTLAEAFAEAGWGTLALVSQRRFSGRLSGLDRGFERYVDEGLDPGSASASLSLLLERHAATLDEALRTPAPLFLFLQCGELGEESVGPPGAGRLLGERLRPLAGDVPGLAEVLGDPEGTARVLSRRRGTPAWRAWRTALYDARLEALDVSLGSLFERLRRARGVDRVHWVVVGTRGCYLLEPRPDDGDEGVSEGLLRTVLLAGLPGLGSGRAEGLVGGKRIAPSLARAFGLEGLHGPTLDAPASELETVLSPRNARRALVTADLAVEVEDDPAGTLTVLGRGATLLVRDPASALLVATAGGAEASLTRDRSRAELVFGSGSGRVVLSTIAQAPPLALELAPAESGPGLAAVLFPGGTSADEAPVPRVPAARGEPWEPEEGAPDPWTVDVRDAGGGWARLVLPGDGPARDVRLFCALYPPDDDVTEGLGVRSARNVQRLTAPSLPGAACLAGRTPLEVEVFLAGRRLALAVELGEEMLPTSAIRYLGRRFDAGAGATLYLPPFLPERLDWFLDPVATDHLGAEDGGEPELAPGTIWIDRGLDPREGPWDLTPEEVRFLDRLKNE